MSETIEKALNSQPNYKSNTNKRLDNAENQSLELQPKDAQSAVKSENEHKTKDTTSDDLRLGFNRKLPTERDLAVRIRNAQKFYGSKTDRIVVLDGLNMTVPKGVIYALLGPSGCGKTTLLNCIVGRTALDSGEMSVLDDTPNTRKSNTLCQRMGYAPQQTALYGEFSIRETLLFFGWIAGMTNEKIEERLKFLVQLLSLPDANQWVNNLSGGQQRRVSLALALLHEPELLILDEPTVGLDPVVRQNIWDHFLSITSSGNTTIIMTTHYIEETRQAHVVSLMRGGYFLVEESPEKLLSRSDAVTLEDVFYNLSVVQDSESRDVNVVNATSMSHNHSGFREASSLSVKFECSKGIKSGFKLFNANHMKPLLWKNVKWIFRNVPLLLFMLLLPLVQNVIFCMCIGKNPINLPIAITNYETNNITHCGNELICNNSQLTCSYLKHLKKQKLILIPYDSEDDAYKSVLKGETYALIVLRQNFSLALHTRVKDWSGSEPWSIAASEVNIFVDVSNYIVTNYLKLMFYETFSNFVRDYMEVCDIASRWLMLPVKWETPVYGSLNPSYTDFVAPALLLIFTFFSSLALTTCITFVEQGEGILERLLVIGISKVEILTAHFLCMCIIMVLQTIISLAFLFGIFDVTLNGSLTLVVLMTLMTGACGMCYGLCLSLICGSFCLTVYAATGSVMISVMASGVFWTTEAMHYVLQRLVIFLPTTQISESLRSVVQKDWGITQFTVYFGFVTTSIWIIASLTISLLFLKYKKT